MAAKSWITISLSKKAHSKLKDIAKENKRSKRSQLEYMIEETILAPKKESGEHDKNIRKQRNSKADG